MNAVRKRLFIIITIILALSLPLILYVLRQQQEIRQRAAGGAVSLILSPATLTKAVGEDFNVELTLNGSDNNISSVDVTVNFGADVLEANSFTPASTFNVTSRNVKNNQNGTIRYTALSLPPASDITPPPTPIPISGSNIPLGTISFRAKAQGTSAVTFSNVEITASRVRTALPVQNNVNGSYIVGQAVSPTTGQPTATPGVGPTATPGTPASTTTPQPTPPAATTTPPPTTPTQPAATPTPCAGCVTFNVTVKLAGIGSDGNPTPKKSPRQAELKVLNTTGTEVAVGSGPLLYEGSSGTFKGPISLTALPAGTYEFKVKAEGYVRRPVPGHQVVAAGAGAPIALPLTTLSSIDTTNDNELNISEYNAYVSCFGAKATNTSSCPNPSIADFNDDGKLDTGDDFSDYKLLFQSFATRTGD